MNKRYVPLIQKPYCCVPACLQMVLMRKGLPLLPQEQIAYELGLIVPKLYKTDFPHAQTGKKPASGWGTQVQKPEYSLNNFFQKHQFLLEETYFFKVKDPTNWIPAHIRNDDVLVCFNNNVLYGGENAGHVSIIESLVEDNIVLIDPEQHVPKYRTVKLNTLFNAIAYHGEKNRAGFWLITSKTIPAVCAL